MNKPRLTIVTRRGLRRILQLVQADIDSMEPGDLRASERREVDLAVAWLTHIAYPDDVGETRHD